MKNKLSNIQRLFVVFLVAVMICGTVTMPTYAAEEWLDSNTVEDYDYAFCLVPDTQILSWSYPEMFVGLYDWIVNNAEEKKIEFVFGLGDITERTKDWEWKFAKENIEKLDGVVPYSLLRGNHDASRQFNDYFPYGNYADELGGSFDGLMNNTWRELVIGDIKYLILTLDYGPSDKVLEWAGEVVAAHPNHNVIVTTHAYLKEDGQLITEDNVTHPMTYDGGKNNADAIWDQFVRKYENIVMVLCGHMSTNDVLTVQTEGDNGNIVTQILVDSQGMDVNRAGTAMVAMLYFSEGGSKVQVEYYSTARDQYFLASNQYTIGINVVEPKANISESNVASVSVEDTTDTSINSSTDDNANALLSRGTSNTASVSEEDTTDTSINSSIDDNTSVLYSGATSNTISETISVNTTVTADSVAEESVVAGTVITSGVSIPDTGKMVIPAIAVSAIAIVSFAGIVYIRRKRKAE